VEAADALAALGAEREAESRDAAAVRTATDAGVPEAVTKWMT
jgi:hypothetical protein